VMTKKKTIAIVKPSFQVSCRCLLPLPGLWGVAWKHREMTSWAACAAVLKLCRNQLKVSINATTLR
jgi:hypothetical protein